MTFKSQNKIEFNKAIYYSSWFGIALLGIECFKIAGTWIAQLLNISKELTTIIEIAIPAVIFCALISIFGSRIEN